MAQYHFSVKMIGRSQGRNAVSAAAYRSGSRLRDERTGETFNFTSKAEVVHSEVMAPRDAPASLRNRQTLWNVVEASEKRKDGQLAREIVCAIPQELSREQGVALAHCFVGREFVSKGMIADLNYHDKEGNPHYHVMLTTREVGVNGFGLKNREWGQRATLNQWREAWALTANRHLELAGYEASLDHRSYKDQGIDREPTRHEGAAVWQMAKRDHITDLRAANQAIIERNNEREWDYGR